MYTEDKANSTNCISTYKTDHRSEIQSYGRYQMYYHTLPEHKDKDKTDFYSYLQNTTDKIPFIT